jgi:hypothetical protein
MMTKPRTLLRSLWLLLATSLLAACGGGSSGGGGQPAASLSGLTLSSGTLAPAFQASTTSYTASVPFAVSSITVTPTASASTTITVNGTATSSGSASAPVALNVGANVITVVASADGATNRSYTVTVTRQAEVFARLSDLVLSVGSLDATFDPAGLSPAGSVGFLAGSVSVTPTAALAGSTITVAGVPVASGEASAPIVLAEGANPIAIVVSAPGATTQAYTLTISRQSAAAFIASAQQVPLPDSSPLIGDGFGASVALAGDTLVVGVPTEGSNAGGTADAAPDSGGVFVYVRNGASWTQQAFLKASTVTEGDVFGSSVALQGDLLVVGAPGEASPGPGDAFGAAYLFRRDAGIWTQSAVLKADAPVAGARFGTAVAVSGGTVAVGAPGQLAAGDTDPSGAAYVFEQVAGSWTQQSLVKADTAFAFAEFGQSVALAGNTLVVGAPQESTNAAGAFDPGSFDRSGAAYVFVRNGTGWDQQAFLKSATVAEGGLFGSSVAVDGDTIAVGETLALVDPASAGRVRVFTRAGAVWTAQQQLQAGNATPGDRFGGAVALAGDVLVVGARFEDGDGTGINPPVTPNAPSGAAYVYTRTGATWSQLAYVKAPDTQAGADFGAAVSLSGDSLAVGAPGAGKVYMVD